MQRDGAPTPRPRLWRITDRSTFAAFHDAQRVRRGPVSVIWLPPIDAKSSTAPPRVAFATGRALGGAVTRNRIRRRLRHALRDLQLAGRLPAGSYLIGGSAALAHCPWSELVSRLSDGVAAATAGERG